MSDLLDIKVSDAELQATLDAAVQAMAHPRELLDDVGAVLEQDINIRFDTHTDPSGKHWQELSALTPAFYAATTGAKGQRQNPSKAGWQKIRETPRSGSGGDATLQQTGHMRASLTHTAGDDFVAIGFSRATPGGKWQVALLHEWGTKSMPRRGLLTASPATGELGEADKADVLAEIERFLTGLF
jgi:phage gpG-like protein